MTENGKIRTPWTEGEVAALDRWQRSSLVHPYTCGNREGHPYEPEFSDHGALRPTLDGWVCPYCDYSQDWAHDFTVEEVLGHG